jgi:hypothetical protein
MVYIRTTAKEKLKAISADQLLVVKEGGGVLPATGWPKKQA